MLDRIKKYYPLALIAPFVIIRLLIIKNSSLTFFSDDAIYASFARSWTQHDFTHVFHPFWPPLYPFISSLVFPLILNWETALRVTSLFASLLLLIPVYFLAKHYTSKLAAILTCTSIFLLGPIVHYSIFPFSDMLAASFIIALIVTLYFALLKNEKRLFVFAAALLGLLYLTRSEGAMFFGLTFIYVICYVTIQKNFKIIPLFLISFLIVISPYAIATHNQLGFWNLSQKFNAQIQQGRAFQIRDGTTWAQEIWSIKSPNYSSKYFNNGPDFVLNNFYSLQKSFFGKIEKWKIVLSNNFPLWFIATSALGLFTIKRKTIWSDLFIIYIILLAIPITIFSTSVIDIRYLLWILPLIVLYFYKGMLKIAQKFSKQFTPIVPFLLVMLIPIFSKDSLDINSYSENFTKEHSRPQLVQIAEFIKSHSVTETPKILTRHEAIEFYSRGKTVYIPQISYPELIDYAKKNNVDYIVAWNRELAQEKVFTTLTDPTKLHDDLITELALDTPEGNIVVYSFP